MNEYMPFENEVRNNIERLGKNTTIQELSKHWIKEIIPFNYAYNFKWLGRPIIQVPQDIVAIQEIIWKEKIDLVVETGIAHGGSLILSASMLALLDIVDAIEADVSFDPRVSKRKVIWIDIEIRPHNRKAIEEHPMASRIEMIEGSSISAEVIEKVKASAKGFSRVMVCLDSNHTHDHVLAELKAYAPMVSVGSYCVVFDTGIEDLPENYYSDRPWGKGNNPKTAVREFLKENPGFKVDKDLEYKLLITSAPDGFLKRIN